MFWGRSKAVFCPGQKKKNPKNEQNVLLSQETKKLLNSFCYITKLFDLFFKAIGF